MAKARGSAAAAQLVACECVILAETKDHQNWELIGHLAEHGQGEGTGVLRADMLKSKHRHVKVRSSIVLDRTSFTSLQLRPDWLQQSFGQVLPERPLFPHLQCVRHS